MTQPATELLPPLHQPDCFAFHSSERFDATLVRSGHHVHRDWWRRTELESQLAHCCCHIAHDPIVLSKGLSAAAKLTILEVYSLHTLKGIH